MSSDFPLRARPRQRLLFLVTLHFHPAIQVSFQRFRDLQAKFVRTFNAALQQTQASYLLGAM